MIHQNGNPGSAATDTGANEKADNLSVQHSIAQGGDQTLSPLGQAALEYADRGWAVFPCKPGGKAPQTGNGHKAATDDTETVRRWWTDTPQANIGLALAPSGLVAVDADTYKEACEWQGFIAGHELPVTLVQKSARGGTHYLFVAEPGATYPGKLCEGVDVKHEGYILLEPSAFEGGQYEWQTDDDPAPAPDWLKSKPQSIPEKAQAKANQTEIAKVIAALENAENTLSRDDWVKLCLGVKGTCGNQARGAFLAFSARYDGARLGEAERVWATSKPDGRIGLGTVFFLLGEGNTDLSEDGLAQAFTIRFGDDLRFDHDVGKWFGWARDHWRMDGVMRAKHAFRIVGRDLTDALDKDAKKRVRKRSFIEGAEAMAKADPAHPVTQDVWDQDPFKLGVPGGVVNLKNGELCQPDRADMITKQAAIAPEVSANCPHWLSFLHEATRGDDEMIEFLRRWCGYCLTGDTREHALIFIYGPGGNGKSVFLNTVTRIMKDYATTAAMDTFTASKGDRHPTDLAMLRGARLVSASETEEGRAWAEARIKQMTGGDPISARFMRQDFFTFTPNFKLTIVGNHAPALANVDDAARRRFNIVPFTVKPENPDRELEAKLEIEWPGILRWMIDGALAWQRDGLQRPESVRAATEQYFAGQDLTAQWLEECATLELDNEHRFENNADLFKSWSDYAKAAGEEPGSAKAMSQRLRRHGLRQKLQKLSGKTYRGWVGVTLHRARAGGNDHD